MIKPPKFTVRKQRKNNSSIIGEWVILDPNGLLHQDDFYNEAHARGVCAQYNLALAAHPELAYAV